MSFLEGQDDLGLSKAMRARMVHSLRAVFEVDGLVRLGGPGFAVSKIQPGADIA